MVKDRLEEIWENQYYSSFSKEKRNKRQNESQERRLTSALVSSTKKITKQ